MTFCRHLFNDLAHDLLDSEPGAPAHMAALWPNR
jgi:hypothetical protein